MNLVIHAVFALLGTVLSNYSADIPPPNDSDLLPRQVTISREHNAYYSLINIEKSLYAPTQDSDLFQDHLAGKKWDDEFVAEILSRNRQARKYFHEATQRPQFRDPTIDENGEFSVDVLMAASTIARVNSLAAAHSLRRGREKKALEEALKIIDNGQMIQDSQGTVVHYLIATDMKRIGLERMQQIAASTTLSPEVLIWYAGRLERYKKNEAGLRAVFKHEYAFFTTALDGALSGKPKSKTDERIEPLRKYSFYFQPNKTKSLHANFVRGQISDVGVPCGLRRNAKIKRLTPSSKLKMFVTENLVGRILVDIATPPYSRKAHEAKCGDDLLVSATQALLALRAYKMRTGRYPTSLDELVPRYMTRVPVDPFDGRLLRYSAEQKMIYSWGTDLADWVTSGGREDSETHQRVFPINF